MNTMYAAVAYRGREIATLRVLGFSRPAILTSFVLESLMLALLGAVVGILLMLPFNGMQTGTSNAGDVQRSGIQPADYAAGCGRTRLRSR